MGVFFRLISILNSNLNKLTKIYFLIKKKTLVQTKLDPRCNKLDPQFNRALKTKIKKKTIISGYSLNTLSAKCLFI